MMKATGCSIGTSSSAVAKMVFGFSLAQSAASVKSRHVFYNGAVPGPCAWPRLGAGMSLCECQVLTFSLLSIDRNPLSTHQNVHNAFVSREL